MIIIHFSDVTLNYNIIDGEILSRSFSGSKFSFSSMLLSAGSLQNYCTDPLR